MDSIRKWIDEVFFAITSGASFGVGTLVLVNEFLQMLAFIVSIIAGILAIRAHLIKRKINEGTKGNEGGST